MIGKLNHIAIAVPSVSNAANQYKNVLGAKESSKEIPNESSRLEKILLEEIKDN